MQSYLFTSCQAVESNYMHLLSLISFHPAFKSKVNEFLPLFPYKLSGDGIIKMGNLIYALLLPDYSQVIQRRTAVQLFNSLEINNDTVTYTHLIEYLLKICSDLVENIDVRSAIGILDMILSRIVDSYVIDAADSTSKIKLQTSIKLEIFDSQMIIADSMIPQKFHRKAGEYIYYEEKVIFEEPKQLKPTQIVTKKLKQRVEQVIPLGYVYEDFSYNYINNNFETKNSYRLKANNKVQIVDKVDYWITLNSATGNTIRDNVVNQQIYQSTSVITATHLPQEISPMPSKIVNCYRINVAFCTPNYYQKLKQNIGSQKQPKFTHFNILTVFYDRNQFNIDQLTLTKQKLIMRRKQHLLGISGKQTIKKQQKDYQVQMKELPLLIGKNKKQYTDEKRMEQNIKELNKSLRMVLEEGNNINTILEKNLSCFDQIPTDTCNTFKEDVVNLAKINPLQILLTGRAKSGKSTLAKEIAKQFNIFYIGIESVIDKVIERSKNFKENPPEPDEDGNIKDGLLKIEECVLSDLQEGKLIEDEDILDLVNLELKRQQVRSKGYILDLPIDYNQYWYRAIIENKIITPKIGCRFFNRIIQIDQTQQQWAHFVKGLMIRPEDSTISSTFDRYLQQKPKPPLQQGEQQQPQAEDGEKPPPLVENNLLQVKWEQFGLPLIEHLSLQINPLHFLKVKNSFQNIQECLKSLKHHLYKIPLAKKIEGSEKQLLTVGLQEKRIARKWSPWGLVDCVELLKERLVMGKFENAAQYVGRVFVFDNEQNLNLFLINPQMFVRKLPSLPKKTNICITGPRKSGKKTIAKLLSDLYGLKIINFEQILKTVLAKQSEDQNHVPSNPERASRSVHLSQGQYKDFFKGSGLNAKDILPIILFQLGVTLQKKPLGWGIQKTDEEGGEPVEQKKPAPKKAKKKDKNDDQRPKTPPLQDIPLKEIIPKINHQNKLDEIKGFILIGYPSNQQQLNALKFFNIPIDKLILLSDNSQQNPYKTLSKRLSESELQQVTNFMTNFAPVKEALGEENCKQLTNLQLSPEELLNKIQQFVDPFYPKVDDDTVNRVCADKQEDGDPIPMGFCGDYCPISLSEGWLIKGKQQFQSGFQGKRFKFVGENQMNLFKDNPTKYIKKQNLVIPPRIMFMGLRGVGLRTQLRKLNQNYKIPIIGYKDSLLQQLQNQKNKRKAERYYNKGFKIPEFDEQGKIVEDPELNDEGAQFDKAIVEVEVTKRMFNGIGEIFINGNYYDVEEEIVATPLVDLLAQARRLPEVVVMLKSSEPKWLQRNLDRKQIQKQLEEIKQKRRQEKRKQREQAKLKAEESGEEYQQPPPQEQQQDPEIPKLQDLITQKQQSLKAQRQGDSGKLEQLTEAFKSWNVEVIQINCQRQQRHVYDRINSALQYYMGDRINKWEQNSMLPIQRHRAEDFLNNYIALQSRFGQLNPFSLMKPVLGYPLVYNDRIYYLRDEEERQMVMRNPNCLEKNQGTAKDILVVGTVAIIGQTKTGKSTLAVTLCKRLGLTHLTIENIIEQFCTEHKDREVIEIIKHLRCGNTLTDEMLVSLIQKRLTMNDCHQNGWLFDGFPMNQNQCDLLSKKNLLPANVFSLKLSQLEIKKRVLEKNKGQSISAYDYDMEVIHERISQNSRNLIEVEVYFLTRLNNLEIFDAKLSRWGLFQAAQKCIQTKVKARNGLVRSLITHSAASASDIGLHFNCIVNQLSDFNNFNSISYKIKREYIKLCPKHHKNLALYQKKIYLFSTQAQMNDFIARPENYKKKGSAFSPPERIFETDILELTPKTQNKGYCPVELTRKKLIKGNPRYILKYHGKYFMTATPANMKLFIRNPAMFELATIPDKLPVQFEKKSDLKKIAKKNDCTAFLQHHLSNILMKCLAQLGYRRPKYPTLGSKQSALKFLSLSLKAININKDEEYRQKYVQKLNKFIKECNYSQQIREQLDRKDKGDWQSFDEQNLIKLSEEYNQFLNELNSFDKNEYFSQFIR